MKNTKLSRARESKMLDELCHKHGYLISDTMPRRECVTMTMERGKLGAAIVLKLMVPSTSVLGTAIQKNRDKSTRVKVVRRKRDR